MNKLFKKPLAEYETICSLLNSQKTLDNMSGYNNYSSF